MSYSGRTFENHSFAPDSVWLTPRHEVVSFLNQTSVSHIGDAHIAETELMCDSEQVEIVVAGQSVELVYPMLRAVATINPSRTEVQVVVLNKSVDALLLEENVGERHVYSQAIDSPQFEGLEIAADISPHSLTVLRAYF